MRGHACPHTTNGPRKNICQKRLSKRFDINRIMWRVYKHTGKDKDYEVYKEALNAATNEVRKSKRNLVVTPEVVANKINNMKYNKSLWVDGIAPKILKERWNK